MEGATRHAGKAFELEMLEPRLLLSATAAAPVAPVVDPFAASSHDVQSDTPATTSGDIAYDPATQIDDILSDADASETDQATTPGSELDTDSEQAASETEIQTPCSKGWSSARAPARRRQVKRQR